MKITLSVPSIILVSIVLASVSEPGSVCNGQVLDTSGNPVKAGVPYYIVPAKTGTGGGLVPASRTFDIRKLCPLDVVQSPFPFIPGIPVTFTVQNGTDKFLQLNTNFNVQFESTVWLCPETKVWRGDGSLQRDGYTYISTGGEIGGPYSWFRIWSEGDDAYKLLYCKNGTECYYIGTYGDNLGVQRLILSNGFLAVKFKKASSVQNVAAEKTTLRMFPAFM
ncbi:PREDICTED: bark lectin-like [Tarenaya hassleriana]|uniref:bark lectin-like n=1 Tax=Tarenaya hassleriana TaxID=28532 RepID=UPI00053C110E|nr:PREDICTED: bark lectin-like [Tarenaya hassleriana]